MPDIHTLTKVTMETRPDLHCLDCNYPSLVAAEMGVQNWRESLALRENTVVPIWRTLNHHNYQFAQVLLADRRKSISGTHAKIDRRQRPAERTAKQNPNRKRPIRVSLAGAVGNRRKTAGMVCRLLTQYREHMHHICTQVPTLRITPCQALCLECRPVAACESLSAGPHLYLVGDQKDQAVAVRRPAFPVRPPVSTHIQCTRDKETEATLVIQRQCPILITATASTIRRRTCLGWAYLLTTLAIIHHRTIIPVICHCIPRSSPRPLEMAARKEKLQNRRKVARSDRQRGFLGKCLVLRQKNQRNLL